MSRNVLMIDGVAAVQAAPLRSQTEARAMLDRIAADPVAYLDLVQRLGVPGVLDLRPIDHHEPVGGWSVWEPVEQDSSKRPG